MRMRIFVLCSSSCLSLQNPICGFWWTMYSRMTEKHCVFLAFCWMRMVILSSLVSNRQAYSCYICMFHIPLLHSTCEGYNVLYQTTSSGLLQICFVSWFVCVACDRFGTDYRSYQCALNQCIKVLIGLHASSHLFCCAVGYIDITLSHLADALIQSHLQ